MSDALDRESLAQELRRWSELERRIALERAVEHLSEASLARLLDGLARIEDHRTERDPRSLNARIEAHLEATRRGEYRGKFDLGNRSGCREPWQTAAWLAGTGHLFDIVLDRARGDAEALDGLRALRALVEDVDARPDELVVFEELPASFQLRGALERAARALAEAPGTR